MLIKQITIVAIILFAFSCVNTSKRKLISGYTSNFWDVYRNGTKVYPKAKYCYQFFNDGTCIYCYYKINNGIKIREKFDFGSFF